MNIFPGLGGAPSIPAPVDPQKAADKKAGEIRTAEVLRATGSGGSKTKTQLAGPNSDQDLGTVSQPRASGLI